MEQYPPGQGFDSDEVDAEYFGEVPTHPELERDAKITLKILMRGRGGRQGQTRYLATKLTLEFVGAIKAEERDNAVASGKVVMIDPARAAQELQRRMSARAGRP